MSGTALVIAAHGSLVEPAVNAQVRSLAEQAAARFAFDEVTPAFHHGHPTYAEVLDALVADEVLVIPLMTSEGYYSRLVLPRELARNRRFSEVRLGITSPVGTHHRMIALVASRVQRLIDGNNLPAARTSLAIVGHGTERNAASRSATIQLADALRRLKLCGEVLYAFLDEDPLVETIWDRAVGAALVVIPFLIARGPHAVSDIPERLGLGVPNSERQRRVGADCQRRGERRATSSIRQSAIDNRQLGHRIIIESPIGADPGIVDIVLDLARSATYFEKALVR